MAPLLRHGPRRVAAETLLIQLPLLLGSNWLKQRHPGAWAAAHATLFVLGGPAPLLWAALRLRLVPGAWWRNVLRDGAFGAALGLGLMALLSPALLLLGIDGGGASMETALGAVALWAALSAGILVPARAAVRGWLAWDRLRRRHLRWALAHAHLAAVAVAGGLVGIVYVGVVVVPQGSLSNLLPTIIVALGGVLVLLLLMLPPSAFFSYLLARQATRRVEALALATRALRAGDYDVRIVEAGTDEIAQLQGAFNAMAGDLVGAMRALQAERDRVAELLDVRRGLIAGVSHELRTPVATMRSYLEAAHAYRETAPPALWRDLQVLERETRTLQALLDDLFTLARADVRTLDLRCVPTDAGAVARRLVETVAPGAWERARVEVAVRQEGEVPRALADPRRLEQVLGNLVQNAVRHTPPGGIVAVAVAAAGQDVELRVEDTGEGMAADDLARIWERFYRGAGRELREGSGLGLALVKELTEAMGGTVAVRSTPGEGSRFTVRLPAAPAGRSGTG